jgi:platelet-activating factor acetylhydrolase
MPQLPEPKGPYAIGATTFVLPIHPSFPVGSSQIRKPTSSASDPHTHKAGGGAKEHLEPTLVFEEVAFTAFYPAGTSSHAQTGDASRSSWFKSWGKSSDKGIDWFIKPVSETLKGYEHLGSTCHRFRAKPLMLTIVHRRELSGLD